MKTICAATLLALLALPVLAQPGGQAAKHIATARALGHFADEVGNIGRA